MSWTQLLNNLESNCITLKQIKKKSKHQILKLCNTDVANKTNNDNMDGTVRNQRQTKWIIHDIWNFRNHFIDCVLRFLLLLWRKAKPLYYKSHVNDTDDLKHGSLFSYFSYFHNAAVNTLSVQIPKSIKAEQRSGSIGRPNFKIWRIIFSVHDEWPKSLHKILR